MAKWQSAVSKEASTKREFFNSWLIVSDSRRKRSLQWEPEQHAPL